MKILRIVSSGYEQGGVENGIVLSNAILRKRGHDVRVLSANTHPELEHYSDYEFSAIPPNGIKKILYTAFNYQAYKVTRRVLADFKPDVVMLHTMGQPTAAILFLLKSYTTVLFIHGPEVFTRSLLPWYLVKEDYRHGSYDLNDLNLGGRTHYYFFRYICGPIYKLGLHYVDLTVALSKYTQSFLMKEGFNTYYLPNGAKLMEPAPIRMENRSLLYAGRLEKFKGVDDLILAMPRILQFDPEVTLHIAGEGSLGKELRALAKNMQLQGSVIFLGHLDQVKLAEAYRRCTIFILPSTWPETFGKVGIEAMSVGRPVIATDVGGISDWLIDGENGYLVKPHNPDQIAQKVNMLLADETKLRRMSRSARRTARRFSIEQMAINIEGLLYKMTKN